LYAYSIWLETAIYGEVGSYDTTIEIEIVVQMYYQTVQMSFKDENNKRTFSATFQGCSCSLGDWNKISA
jgi:hypothetical protein